MLSYKSRDGLLKQVIAGEGDIKNLPFHYFSSRLRKSASEMKSLMVRLRDWAIFFRRSASSFFRVRVMFLVFLPVAFLPAPSRLPPQFLSFMILI